MKNPLEVISIILKKNSSNKVLDFFLGHVADKHYGKEKSSASSFE